MSSTRHVKAGGAPTQHGFASASEYAELRGVCGTIVAAKAELAGQSEKRSLLFFLQALSMRPGGFKRLAQDLVALFPERLGSPTMLAAGIQPGGCYDQETARQINQELIGRSEFLGALVDMALSGTRGDLMMELLNDNDESAYESSHDVLYAKCQKLAQGLPEFLERLCVDPEIQIALPGEGLTSSATCAQVPYFQDLTGALLEYQRRTAEQARQNFVVTSIGKQVYDTLNFALGTQTMAVIEGDPRFGKSAAAEAWIAQHLGEARYVKLPGINSRTIFFRTLAKALGLPSTFNLSPSRMQARVEDFLQRSRLMLILDDAQFLWPQSQRIHSQPELLNWVTTALYNNGIPVALITWDEFSRRRADVERQTDWKPTHFSGRTTLYHKIKSPPTEEDFFAVVRKLLPEGCNRCLKFIVGYAVTSTRYMQAVVDTVKIARYLANQAGRGEVLFEDVKRAIENFRMPSDAAQVTAAPAPGRRRRAPALPEQPACNPDAALLPSARRDRDFTGVAPVDSSTEMPPRTAVYGRAAFERLKRPKGVVFSAPSKIGR